MVFTNLTSAKLCSLLNRATDRVLYCSPGMTQDVAAAIIAAGQRIGVQCVRVVLDVTAQSARLGYGEFDAVTLLTEHGVDLRQESGLRLSVVVADDVGYAFFLPPLLVEDIDELAAAPNAVALGAAQVQEVASAIAPHLRTKTSVANAAAPTVKKEPEIGLALVKTERIEQIRNELASNPPQKFDLARKVNVFNAYIEFVELSLTGTHVVRHTVQLPQDLILATRDADTQRRVQTSFKLVNEDSKLAKDARLLADAVGKLRTTYLHPLGTLGSVIRRSKRKEFEAAVNSVQKTSSAFERRHRNAWRRKLITQWIS